jgi:hypothetical protein
LVVFVFLESDEDCGGLFLGYGAVRLVFLRCDAEENSAGGVDAGGEKGGVSQLALVYCGSGVGGKGWAHGEEFLFGADEGLRRGLYLW